MPRFDAAKYCLLLAGAGLLLCAMWPAGGQQTSHAQPPKAVAAQPKYFFGNDSCAICHDLDSPADAEKKKRSVVFMRGNEMKIWSNQDKHKAATMVLFDKKGRGPLMAKNLKLDPDKLLAEKQCINCHGVYVDETKDKFEKASFSEAQRAESGVSCVLCHGPAKLWVEKHQVFSGDEWRSMTREEKTAMGLNDLWNPEKRAALCCSCHIGNASEQKVVTHEMYAAGHPPLPSIEIASFGDSMPRHWETWQEKLQRLERDLEAAKNDKTIGAKKKYELIEERKELYRHSYHFDTQPPETQQLELTVISSLVVFRESMRLLAGQAKMGVEAKEEKNAWPELAAFDCYACHHDLKVKSWRLERGYKGAPPGRPDMHEWPIALLPLGFQYIEQCTKQAPTKEQADLKEKLRQLQKAFTSQPFGNAEEIAAKAEALRIWSDEWLKKLRACRCDLASARPLLLGLTAVPEKRLLDFDSARQVSWAFAALAPDLRPELFFRKPGQALIEVKTKSLPAEEARALCETLAALKEALELELPKEQVAIVPDFLHKTMPKIAAYEADTFRERIAVLRQTLNKLKKE